MALIALCTYCTEENKKFDMLDKTLLSLSKTVDLSKHRIMLWDNSTEHKIRQKIFLLVNSYSIAYYTKGENIGTARGINQLWAQRKESEHLVKMDDDVVISEYGWVDQLEYAINQDQTIGIIGLKRKDCWEHPDNPNTDYRSKLSFLPTNNQKWVVIEDVSHVIGTCQMYNAELIKRIGYLFQIGLYGYDDVLASHRSQIAGFRNCFLPHIEIDHIDDGSTPYQDWKQRISGEIGLQIRQKIHEYYQTKDVYQPLY